MVRGLVEQHEIGPLRQRARQKHAPPHSAGERVEDGIRLKPHLRDELVRAGDLPHRARTVLRHLLLKVGYLEARRAYDLPRVGLDQPGYDLEKRGLPLAVAARHARANAALHIERDILQNRITPEREGDAVQ